MMYAFSRLTSASTVSLSREARSLVRSGMKITSLADMNMQRSRSFCA